MRFASGHFCSRRCGDPSTTTMDAKLLPVARLSLAARLWSQHPELVVKAFNKLSLLRMRRRLNALEHAETEERCENGQQGAGETEYSVGKVAEG